MSVPLEGPEEVDPTDRTFFPRAGDPIVQASWVGMYSHPPSLPAANMRRLSGFWNITTRMAEGTENFVILTSLCRWTAVSELSFDV